MVEGCNKGEERGCKQGGKEAANKVRKETAKREERGCKLSGKEEEN